MHECTFIDRLCPNAGACDGRICRARYIHSTYTFCMNFELQIYQFQWRIKAIAAIGFGNGPGREAEGAGVLNGTMLFLLCFEEQD